MTSLYNTNFIKSEFGNALKIGTDLLVTIEGNPEYVKSDLYQLKSFASREIIQIERTGTKCNLSNNKIRFEMTQLNGKPLPRGQYTLETKAFFTSAGQKGWNDDFQIIK